MGKLQGTRREHVARLTVRRPLKIALSGVFKLGLALERGQGRAEQGRVGWLLREMPLSPLSFHSILKEPWSLWKQDPGGCRGELCEGTHPAGIRQGEKGKLGWRSRDGLFGSMTLGGHLTHVIWHCHPSPTHKPGFLICDKLARIPSPWVGNAELCTWFSMVRMACMCACGGQRKHVSAKSWQ